MNISAEQAVGILEVLGCEYDPIFYGKDEKDETTPSNLTVDGGGSVLGITPASQVYIQYWGVGAKKRWGTLQGMVKERMHNTYI